MALRAIVVFLYLAVSVPGLVGWTKTNGLGHAERQDRLKLPMKWFHAMWALLLFTAATRMTSDFLPKVRMTHFTYAAILWLAILVFWMWKMRRELKRPLPQALARFKSPFVR